MTNLSIYCKIHFFSQDLVNRAFSLANVFVNVVHHTVGFVNVCISSICHCPVEEPVVILGQVYPCEPPHYPRRFLAKPNESLTRISDEN